MNRYYRRIAYSLVDEAELSAHYSINQHLIFPIDGRKVRVTERNMPPPGHQAKSKVKRRVMILLGRPLHMLKRQTSDEMVIGTASRLTIVKLG